MSTFPPKKATKTPNTSGNMPEGGLVSTGNGGIAASLKMKNASNKTAPGAGPDKTVLTF